MPAVLPLSGGKQSRGRELALLRFTLSKDRSGARVKEPLQPPREGLSRRPVRSLGDPGSLVVATISLS